MEEDKNQPIATLNVASRVLQGDTENYIYFRKKKAFDEQEQSSQIKSLQTYSYTTSIILYMHFSIFTLSSAKDFGLLHIWHKIIILMKICFSKVNDFGLTSQLWLYPETWNPMIIFEK